MLTKDCAGSQQFVFQLHLQAQLLISQNSIGPCKVSPLRFGQELLKSANVCMLTSYNVVKG